MMKPSALLSNRYVYTAGLFAAHLVGRFKFSVPVDPDIMAALNEHGCYVLPGFLSEILCNQLIHCFDEREDVAAVFDSDRRIFGMEKLSELHLRVFADSVFLKTIGDAYVGMPQILTATMAAKLYAAPDKLGSGGGWHRDSFLPQFKAICYLTDVSEANGPFEYVPGSHRLANKLRFELKAKTRERSNSPRYSPDSIEEYCRILGVESKIYAAQKGTVILCDTSGLHRGRPIMQGVRYAVTNYYRSPRLFLDRRARQSNVYAQIDDTMRTINKD